MNRLGRIARHLTYESDDSVLRCVADAAAAAVPEAKTRYAIVGLGGRSVMYSGAILSLYTERAELVGICDINRKRMEYYIDQWTEEYGDAAADISLYSPEEFEQMIQENDVDTVIVTSMDRTHHRYIIRAMEAGCDCITEKPMTVDEKKCQDIIDCIERTGQSLRVTFNYRYAPRASKVKELIMKGAIGEVKSIHFEWLLDTRHGADYFRRWHRNKNNSGGLMVHKATHHFDLVNWWIDSHPVEVSAMGDLDFYGRENAEERGVTKFYDRGTDHPNAKGDPFAIDLNSANFKDLYLDPAEDDGYRRDQSVFGDGINIEDDMAVLVRYANGAKMSYHLTAYSPWEGYRVAFNGTKGRIELDCEESPYTVAEHTGMPVDGGDGTVPNIMEAIKGNTKFQAPDPVSLRLRLLWQEPLEIPIPGDGEAGHGGGDRRLLDDIFIGGIDDPLMRAADHVQGARSILTGIAANKSFMTGERVRADELVRFPEEPAPQKQTASERLEEMVSVTDEVDAE